MRALRIVIIAALTFLPVSFLTKVTVADTNDKSTFTRDIKIDSKSEIKKNFAKPEVKGAVVYKTYCLPCHGEKGDGVARAMKLYGKENLVINDGTNEYYEKIIRNGSKVMGKSLYMPMWEDELSDNQIKNVITYVESIKNVVMRGMVVFSSNCIFCHGIKGNGKGRTSFMYDPPPANLTISEKTDEYKREIITKGGKAMGRSEVMPQWGLQLTKQEIDDVVAYLRTILVKNL